MRLIGTMTLAVAAAVGPGCGDDGGRGDGLSTLSATGPMTGIVSAADTMTKLDVGGGDGATMGMAETNGDPVCERVDVVLSVDNSSSMQEEIDALKGPVFDSFPQALLDVGNGLLDFQLAVIDACNDPPAFHDHGSAGPCGFSTGTNFMISSSPDLAAEYSCVTDFTDAGYMGMPDACTGDNDDEQPANTAADAVTDAMGTNVGFMRDDAVLMIVAITDEDEKPIPDQTPQQIVDKIVAAKGSINNVVFLGIGGGSLCDGPYGTAIPATTLQQVAQIFEASGRGLFWDLCQGDLTQAFEAVIEVVDSACVEFDPEG